jgi:hypothetical protein
MLPKKITASFSRRMPVEEPSRTESRLLTGLFLAALIYSLAGVTYHWTKGFLSGHEFRQTQTALITHYIDKDDNFSLLYETPLVGKPWVSILMEVPLYEWAVVGLSRSTGLPHFMAARTVSAACFYLSLPALYLLLGRFGLPRPRRLLVLALVLCAPVYIYYSRAFLIDAMAFMFSAWWLLAFVRAMDERRWPWLVLATVAGTGAALVKSATFAVWLPPAAAYGAWLLGRDLRAGTGWRAPLQTLAWGLATVVVALGALRAWIAYTDPIKAAHASAWIFTSQTLSQGNWGLFDLRALFSAEVWRQLLHCWEQAIASRWIIAGGLLAGLTLPRVRGPVLGLGAAFFAAQALFPNAYAYQDYYFYSIAVFGLAALGFTLVGLLDTGWPRVLVALIVAVPFAAQVRAYWQDYRVGQSADLQGGFPLTDLLRDHTPEGSVLVIAGADWAGIVPYYSQRKALMIRNGLEDDRAYLRRAFNDLEGENISALVLHGPLRQHQNLITIAAVRLGLDARGPTFSYQDVDVYVPKRLAPELRTRLAQAAPYAGVTVHPPRADEAVWKHLVAITPERAQSEFKAFSPAPFQADFQFGLGWMGVGGRQVLSAHPDANLWIKPPADTTRITWTYGLLPGAYDNPASKTDGVEFIITGELPDGSERRIHRRVLDPWANPADRGEQTETIAVRLLPGEVLRFTSGPFETPERDWAYFAEIRVEP